MSKATLAVQPRKIYGRKVKTLRAGGTTPGNVFGKNISSQGIQMDPMAFRKLYHEVGTSGLIYLQVEGEKEPRPVIISAVHLHPVTDQLLHVDFHQVSLKEKIVAPVAVRLVGEAPAEKEKLGIVVQQLDEVEVEALPTDMPQYLEAQISGLTGVGSAVTVGELKWDAAKLTVKTAPETIVVKVEPLAKEETEEKPAVAPVEGELPAEGAAAPVKEEAKPEEEPAKEEK